MFAATVWRPRDFNAGGLTQILVAARPYLSLGGRRDSSIRAWE